MNSQDSKDEYLQQRERELQEREQALCLREIEAEINQPLSATAKHHKSKWSLNRRYKPIVEVAKFVGIVIAVVVVVRVVSRLAGAVIIGAIAWFGYTLFFKGNRR